MITKILAVASTVVLFATGAQAVTFNLTGSGGGALSGVGAQTATFNMGGVSGEVMANSTYNSGSSAVITGDNDGIGVDNGRSLDNDDVDGWRGDDWLTFSFDSAVQLASITFGHAWYDTIDIAIGNGDYTSYNFSSLSGSVIHSFGNVIADTFSVRATGIADTFVVSSFTVAPIPLPASALLLIGGLAGFGVMRRRKRMAA